MVNLGYRHNRRFVATGADTYAGSLPMTATRNRYSRWGPPCAVRPARAVGMFWADVSWVERLGGIRSFPKFLVIPFLLYQFHRSDAGRQVLLGFLGSCVVLLVVSWLLWIWPGMPWPGTHKSIGVPVKDYIAQSSMFTFCALVIIRFAYDKWKDGHRRLALALILLTTLFFLNVLYVATSRTYPGFSSFAAGVWLSSIGMERSHRFGCWLSFVGDGSLAFSDVPKR